MAASSKKAPRKSILKIEDAVRWLGSTWFGKCFGIAAAISTIVTTPPGTLHVLVSHYHFSNVNNILQQKNPSPRRMEVYQTSEDGAQRHGQPEQRRYKHLICWPFLWRDHFEENDHHKRIDSTATDSLKGSTNDPKQMLERLYRQIYGRHTIGSLFEQQRILRRRR